MTLSRSLPRVPIVLRFAASPEAMAIIDAKSVQKWTHDCVWHDLGSIEAMFGSPTSRAALNGPNPDYESRVTFHSWRFIKKDFYERGLSENSVVPSMHIATGTLVRRSSPSTIDSVATISSSPSDTGS